MLLALSIDAYKFGSVSLGIPDYQELVKGTSNIHSQVIQDVGRRLYKAFQNFFRRVKSKEAKKGFPRFKSRVNSITYPQRGFKFISNKHIKVSKIGNLPIILHRVPKGKIKTFTIKQTKTDKWFAMFACELPDTQVKHPSAEKVGIDVGIENFATLSNGESIANPHHLIKSESRLKLLHRRVSRKVKGSRNRVKARFRLAKLYERIANQRSDFLHKSSHRLAKAYSFIAIEELNINGMMQNHILAKHIGDAGWGTFISFLKYKAVRSGGSCVENPHTRGSSHRCSKCGAWNEITLSQRTFHCCSCSFVCHRDLNASINHLNDTVGLTGISTPVETLPLPSLSDKASDVVEAGTINDIV